jgi:hypothetical protein
MSEQTPKIIIETKQKIQRIVSNLMSNSTITKEENILIRQISQYKVATNLKNLSETFGNVLESSQGSSSGAS